MNSRANGSCFGLCIALTLGGCLANVGSEKVSEDTDRGTAIGEQENENENPQNETPEGETGGDGDVESDASVPETDDSDDDTDDTGGQPDAAACADAADRAPQVLDTYCASCHGEGAAGYGRFTSLTDTAGWVESGLVVPDDPETSALYTRMASGSMPPSGSKPLEEEIEAVYTWIKCGGAEAWSGN